MDVFLVISGYLIAGILSPKQSVRLIGFWVGRLRRLLPAMVLVFMATLTWGYWALAPVAYLDVAQAGIAGLLGLANLWFAQSTGYFVPAAADNPLLHSWTLSLEWQFYLVMPLIFALPRQSWVVALGTLTLVSFVWALAGPGHDYFNLHVRFWQFGVGALAFMARPRGLVSEGWCWLALMALLATAVTLDGGGRYPGGWALVPVICAVVLIWYGDRLPWLSFAPWWGWGRSATRCIYGTIRSLFTRVWGILGCRHYRCWEFRWGWPTRLGDGWSSQSVGGRFGSGVV